MSDRDIQLLEALKVDDRPPTSDEIERQREQLLILIETQPATPKGRQAASRPFGHRLRLVAVLGAVILIAGIAVSVVSTRPAVAQIEVELVDGFYEITVVELGEDTSQVESELAALGIDLIIDFIPASPSLEGQVVAFGINEEVEPVLDPNTGQLTMLRVPVDWEGRGLIEVGRPAMEGETYNSSASPLADGEALENVEPDAIYNQPIEEVAELLTNLGFGIDIRSDYDFESHEITLDEARGMFVEEVGYSTPDVIQVWVVEEPGQGLERP
jgi:hypothetical protein